MQKRIAALLLALSVSVSPGIFAGETSRQASPELKSLEKEVSLKIAHLSGEGSVDPARLAQLREAHQLDVKAEQAIAAGDYDSAEDDLVKANAILGRLGM